MLNSNMRNTALRVVILFFTVFLPSLVAFAQGSVVTLLLPGELRGTILLYCQTKGVGWSFVPAVEIRILELGLDNNSSTMNVTLWTSALEPIRSDTITPLFGEFGETYQSISPVVLLAGSQYYISAQLPTGSLGGTASMVVNGGGRIAPQLEGFTSYFVHTDDTWHSSTPVYGDTLFLGPTFRFEVVPEPGSITIGMMGVASLIFRFRRGRKPRPQSPESLGVICSCARM